MLRKSVLIVLVLLISTSFAMAKASLKIGSPAPELKLKTINSAVYEVPRDNKPMVVLFFTSWSKSAKEEILTLEELKKRYKSRVRIIGISLDRKLADLKEFIAENDVDLTILRDPKLKALKSYRVLIIPTAFLIDRQGNISRIYVDFDENIAKALDRDVAKLID